jgi:hypothetical protein
MITFEEARSIASKNIPSDCEILPDSIIEKPYGWYFYHQSKEYIETGNIKKMLVGSGGFVVEKESGEVVKFGSAYSLEKNFQVYERGLIGRKDLIILKVREINESVRLLNRLQMTYIEPEIAHGVEWKIPKLYNEKQIKEAISKLPFAFVNQNFYFRYDEFEKIDDSKCFEYKLQKH